MRSCADLRIGICVTIRTTSGKRTAALRACTVVRHCGVDRIRPEVVVVGTELRETARAAGADILTFRGKDKEHVGDIRRPAVCTERVAHLVLNIRILRTILFDFHFNITVQYVLYVIIIIT
jgi:hypothetical protein